MKKQPFSGEVVGTETLTHSCGHSDEFTLFKDDPWRDARRENHGKKACKECRDAKAKELQDLQAAAKAAKRAAGLAKDEAQREAARLRQLERAEVGESPLSKEIRQSPVKTLPHGWELFITKRSETHFHGRLTLNGITVCAEWEHGGSVRELSRHLARQWRLAEKAKAETTT